MRKYRKLSFTFVEDFAAKDMADIDNTKYDILYEWI